MGVPTRTVWPAGPKAGARTMTGCVAVALVVTPSLASVVDCPSGLKAASSRNQMSSSGSEKGAGVP